MSKSAPTARGRRTRDAILAAAADLFHRRGYHATSIDEILAASGTGKGQFYHFFDGKEALVRAVMQDRAERFLEMQAPLLERLDCWEGIRAWFDAIVAIHECRGFPGCPFAMLASELADRDPALRIELAHFFDRWRVHLARGLAAMLADGRLRADADPDALSHFVLAAIQGGILLSKTVKDVGPLRSALDEAFHHLRSYGRRARSGPGPLPIAPDARPELG